MKAHLTLRSENRKVGPIPVSTTEPGSCPDDCAMRGECYGAAGPLALHWRAVAADRGIPWEDFCSQIEGLPEGQLWRHNQAGDLPRKGRTVDPVALGRLVWANRGRRGFTYSHHRDPDSLRWIRAANDWGFTVNLSANDLPEADRLAETEAGPVVVVVRSDQMDATTTPAGRPVVICPAARIEGMTCAKCQLCQVRDRKSIVGFPAHGNKKRIIDIRLGKS